MCGKASSFILLLYFFLHAYDAFDATEKKAHLLKEVQNLKDGMNINPISLNPEETKDICEKGMEVTKSRIGSFMPCHRKILLQHSTKSEDSRSWSHENVREMELRPPFFGNEDLSEADYQPPHRKSPIHNK